MQLREHREADRKQSKAELRKQSDWFSQSSDGKGNQEV